MQIAFILTKICVEVERLKFNFRFIQVRGSEYTYGLILYLYVCLSSYVMIILAGYRICFNCNKMNFTLHLYVSCYEVKDPN